MGLLFDRFAQILGHQGLDLGLIFLALGVGHVDHGVQSFLFVMVAPL